MTTSLRTRVVEAGARAYFGGFDVMTEGGQRFCLDVAAQVLDRMLDCLTENADEWKRAAYEMVADTDRDVFGSAALAVLREDR